LPLIQHLDATVEGSLVTNGSNEVTEWKDQTTFNNNAVTLTGSIYKVQDGSLSWLDFGTDRNVMQLFSSSESDIWLDQSTGSDGFCVILSFKTNSLNEDWNDVIGNSSVVSAGFGLRYSNSGTIKAYLGGKDISTAGSNIEAGKPVVGFWGLGNANRQMTPAQATQILDSFQKPAESKYQVYVMGGVPNDWRTNTKEGFMPVYERLDMISPWRPIFYDPYNQVWLDRMAGDKAWCDARGIDYNPTVSPGASVAYQNFDPTLRNKNPRNGGKYLWKQVYEICKLKNKFIYVAMYDEIDEGTAMYKMAKTQDECPVLDPSLVPLNEDGYDLPGDWYLQIGTEIQKMLEGTIPLTNVLPINPSLASTITDNLLRGILKVYPIPANRKLIVAGAEQGSRFAIFNILGIKIMEGDLLDGAIDISSLKYGIYILSMNGNSIRFVKV